MSEKDWCPLIQKCKRLRTKNGFESFCLKNFKACTDYIMSLPKKTPSEWLKSLKEGE